MLYDRPVATSSNWASGGSVSTSISVMLRLCADPSKNLCSFGWHLVHALLPTYVAFGDVFRKRLVAIGASSDGASELEERDGAGELIEREGSGELEKLAKKYHPHSAPTSNTRHTSTRRSMVPVR